MPPNMEGPAEQRVILSAVIRALGRLRPGVSPTQAATEARTILQWGSDELMARVRENRPAGDVPEVGVRVVPLLEEMVGEYRPAPLALAAATALVLLIACINVAGLLLARGVTRRRMLAVCAALGAGRGRLARQLLTESMALSLGGGVLGLATAASVLRPRSFRSKSPGSTRWESTRSCSCSPWGCRSSSGCCSARRRCSNGHEPVWCSR